MTSAQHNDTSRRIAETLQRQQQAFIAEGAVSAETRIHRLNQAIDMIYDNRDRIVETLNEDFGNRSRHQSRLADIAGTLESLKYGRKHLRRWMRPEKRKPGFPMNLLGAKARVEYQPKGVVGIIGTWNFPVWTVMSPLAGALAAGNRAMIKFSEVTPRCGALLEELIGQYFDEEVVAGFNGGPEVGASFAAQPFDHIIFTGATSVGRHILAAAANNLTPVTLELGGKSPVLVSRSADLKEAAARIMTGKALNMGQVCLSPDYIFVPQERLKEFLDLCAHQVREMFPDMLDNPDYTSVVNARHLQRLQSYLDDARGKQAEIQELKPDDEDFNRQRGTHKLPLNLVIEPPDDSLVMQEELFGPILCFKTYRDFQECIDFINRRPHPLGLYYFGKDRKEERHLLDSTRSGGVSINDVAAHVSCEDLPFGGIGDSGMGHYHGRDGFRTFSHARPIFHQSRINLQALAGLLPPYGDKADKTLNTLIKK